MITILGTICQRLLLTVRRSGLDTGYGSFAYFAAVRRVIARPNARRIAPREAGKTIGKYQPKHVPESSITKIPHPNQSI
jgi:hypothetical protein